MPNNSILITRANFDTKFKEINNKHQMFVKNINLDRKISATITNLATKDDRTTAGNYTIANRKKVDDFGFFVSKNYFSCDGSQNYSVLQ